MIRSLRSFGSHPEQASLVGSIGALAAADNPSPSTKARIGGIDPPSSIAALSRNRDCPVSVLRTDRFAELVFLFADQLRPGLMSRSTWLSTIEACSPPITEMRAFGHNQRKRGCRRPHMP